MSKNTNEFDSEKYKNTQNMYDFLKLGIAKNPIDRYVRDTCLHSKLFDINEKDSDVVDFFRHKVYEKKKEDNKQSFTTIRTGFLYGPSGVKEEVFIKSIIATDIASLNDVKYNVEAYSVMPDHISDIKMLDACDVLTYEKKKAKSNFIVVATEKLLSFKEYITSMYKASNQNGFKKAVDNLLNACDLFNKYGFFHENLKYENIGIRKGTPLSKVVLTDFTETVYIEDINVDNGITSDDLAAKKPPLNSFYACVYILKNLVNIKNVPNSRPLLSYLRNKALHYYKLIKSLLEKDDVIDFLHKNSYNVTRIDVEEFATDGTFKKTKDSNSYINDVLVKHLEKINLDGNKTLKDNLKYINSYLEKIKPAPKIDTGCNCPVCEKCPEAPSAQTEPSADASEFGSRKKSILRPSVHKKSPRSKKHSHSPSAHKKSPRSKKHSQSILNSRI